jgi:hypothetical protein
MDVSMLIQNYLVLEISKLEVESERTKDNHREC